MTESIQPEVSFDDLLASYRQNPKYGEEWVRTTAEQRIDYVRQVCQEKDYARLRSLMFKDNAFLREVFTRLTGIALPKTQRDSHQRIVDYVGPDAVQRYWQEKEHQSALEAVKRLQQRLQGRRVTSTRYGTLTMDAFIEHLVREGYTSLKPQPRGATTKWFLCNDQRGGYTFLRRDEKDYIEYLLAQHRQTPSPDNAEGAPEETQTEE